jgi:hypothetical protein
MLDFTLTDNNNQIRASSLKLTIALDDMKRKEFKSPIKQSKEHIS